MKTAAVLANQDIHTDAEIQAARKRFRNLDVAELSMVEAPEVEGKMIALAEQVDKELTTFTPAQHAAYNLAHALRDSFISSWRLSR